MAYTKIHAVKATVHKAIKYICNPEKTDGNLLVTSYACAPETAAYDFKAALSRTNASDGNLAFHLIQSFAPGEVEYDEAHQIGIELADKILKGKYCYIVATHIDKGHIHNHIIFCAADNLEHKKYNDCRQTYREIRATSDALCHEHKLSIITPGLEDALSYVEWMQQKKGPTWKDQVRTDIDASIKEAEDYDGFLSIMKEKGYTLKGEKLSGDTRKAITFTKAGMKRGFRGAKNSLGSAYTRDRISERILEKFLHTATAKGYPDPINSRIRQDPIKVLHPEESMAHQGDDSNRKFIDTTQERFQNSPALLHWAKLQNLKIAAAKYQAASSLSDLKSSIEEKDKASSSARSSMVELEHRMKGLLEILKYGEQYKTYRKYDLHYKKSTDPERYFREHESELILYGGAKRMLTSLKINPSKLDLPALKTQYQSMEKQHAQLQKSHQDASKEAQKLRKEYADLQHYLDLQAPEETRDSEQRQNQHLS